MKVVLRRLAKLDLLEARRWYEERQPGLGDKLLEEVEAALASIEQWPELPPKVDDRVRRAALQQFPYGIFYVSHSGTIRVIAILHRARHPERWRSRR